MNDTPRTDAAIWMDDYGREYVHADFARQLERAVPTWTPTADLAALPPFDTYVIVHSRSGVTSLMHRSRHGRGGWAWREHLKTWAQSEITHWMPKPDAPEAEVAT